MGQNYKIYISDTPVYLLDAPEDVSQLTASEHIQTIELKAPSEFASELNSMQFPQTKPIAFYTQQSTSEALFEALADQYDHELAGGGLVVDDDQRVLLIYRRGCWDLPKGKLDEGEDWAEAAKREVEEETGVQVTDVRQLLATTFYTFQRKGRNTLKETRWYLMTAPQTDTLSPQTEEDIEEVRWVRPDDVADYLGESYPSLMDVFRQWQALGQ